MLKDIPYRVLKEDGRAYEILLLRDRHANTYTGIAKEYRLSVARVTRLYHKQKVRQIRLYLNHIAIALGHENTAQIRKIYHDAENCYRDQKYACAYLEKKYKKILTDYRNGEPGMPAQFLRNMPPFQRGWSEAAIARVIEMREAEQASWITIAEELRMTREKAKHTYDMFYHRQVLELIGVLQENAGSEEEKTEIFDCYFGRNLSSKKRYEMLTEKSAVPPEDA